jgi:hypothetical protein
MDYSTLGEYMKLFIVTKNSDGDAAPLMCVEENKLVLKLFKNEQEVDDFLKSFNAPFGHEIYEWPDDV